MELSETSKIIAQIIKDKGLDISMKYEVKIMSASQNGQTYMSEIFRVKVMKIMENNKEAHNSLQLFFNTDNFSQEIDSNNSSSSSNTYLIFELVFDHINQHFKLINNIVQKYRQNDLSKTKEVLSLIYKIPSTSEIRKINYNIISLFEREAYIYSDVVPQFNKLQNSNQNLLPKLPRVAFVSNIPNHEIFMMEDLEKDGFKSPNRTEPLDRNHCALALEGLAKFHAFSFALRDQNPILFKKLSDITEMQFLKKDNADGEYVLRKTIDYIKEMFNDDKDEEIINKLDAFKNNFGNNMAYCVASENAEPYSVICHGDCWIGNFMFKYNKNSCKPSEVCIMDWQVSRLASPVTDISYFIFACTDAKTRKNHLLELLNMYYNILSKTISELGSNSNKLYPYAVFEEHLKRFSKFGFGITTILMHTCTCDPEELPDVERILNKGDKNYLEEIMEPLVRKRKYRERISAVTRDAVKLGFL